MSRARTLIATLAMLTIPGLGHAQTPPPADHDYPPVMDSVTLDLSAEDWVETATAKVVVSIDTAVPGSDAGKVRAEMLKAVDGLVPGATWRFSSFDRSQDQSGLERSHAELETRLKESDMGGLADKAKQESKPGLQLQVNDIDFTPTLAETEAVRSRLRNQIYGQVNDELKRLAAAEPDRKFRMGTIDFSTGEVQQPRPQRFMAKAMMAPAAAQDAAPISVEQKLRLDAHVVLSAIAPKE